MSTRDELEDAIDEALGDRQNWESYGGFLSLADEASRNIADALIAEGWRKKPSEAEVIAVLDDDMNWDVGELSPVLLMEQTARAILALMDRGQ